MKNVCLRTTIGTGMWDFHSETGLLLEADVLPQEEERSMGILHGDCGLLLAVASYLVFLMILVKRTPLKLS